MTEWPDLAALQLLVGIDDLGGLGASARAAGVAQPNATRSVRRLEKQLGAVLVRRGRSGSVLTPEAPWWRTGPEKYSPTHNADRRGRGVER